MGDWYDCIEEPIRDLVRLLRNNGFNTTCSCGHAMIIEMAHAPEDAERLWTLLIEHDIHHFQLICYWEGEPLCRKWIELKLTVTSGTARSGECECSTL